MKKSYVSPDFDYLEIELSDPICSSGVEFPAEGGGWGDGWDDEW